MSSLLHRSARAAALVVVTALFLEAATRVFFSFSVGPRLLLYGTPWHRNQMKPSDPTAADRWADSVQNHQNHVGDYHAYVRTETTYSKYFPHETKWTESPDRSEHYPVRINNHGFRGADYAVEKPPGTFRVVTLGASSTFGYHDRDDETYPFLLERDLQAVAAPGTTIEVINLAIPHSTTDNVLALFLAEGVALRPDVVTFYEGANDSVRYDARTVGRSGAWLGTLARWSLLAAWIDSVMPRSEAADADWWWSDEFAALRSRDFITNLERLSAECRSRGIELIVATQQLRSMLVPDDEIRGVTYADEVEMVRGRLARGDVDLGPASVPASVFKLRTNAQQEDAARTFAMFEPARVMLVHARLMDDQRAWAARTGVRLVDVIHALDDRRDLLVNWVHLNAEANAIIAAAFASVIGADLAARRDGAEGAPRAPS